MCKTILALPDSDLQSLLDSAPENSTVQLPAGVFRQKLVIRTRGLTLLGAGREKTRIVYDDHARKRDFLGAQYNTFRTYTLAVCADGVTIRDLCVENDALRPEEKGQEVALSVVADAFSMEDCILRSTQDTLFAGPLPSDLIGRYEGFLHDELRRCGSFRQRFVNCRIEGTVDFIFGCADALFENCCIHSLTDGHEMGYVAAPAHELRQERGFHFRKCAFTCREDVPAGSVYLARPWRDYGMAFFEDCSYGAHIIPEGFHKWNDTDRDKTARFREAPPRPGRVPWVNREEREAFLP